MHRPLRLVLLAVAVCGTGAASGAAATPTLKLLTPKAMAARIHGTVPQIPTSNQAQPSTIIAATCRGLGTSHKGKFATFRCKAQWERGTAPVWARVLPGGTFCASATGLSACPAPPAAAGDPRICSNPPTPPTADPNRCARSATELAVVRAMKVWFGNPNWKIGFVNCDGANLGWKCTYLQFNVFGIYYNAVVDFAQQNGSWAATIATSGNGRSSTCTVQPDPSTAAGTPSSWATGPDPSCEL